MKKSIGPIVASSFLLVVVVISTVSFQNWFTSFEATTLASAESKTSGSSNGTTQIADIIGTSLYFQNGYPNLTVKSIRVYENDCNVSTTIGSGVKTLTLGNNCTQNLPNERAEVSVVTDKGIFRGAFYNEYAGVNTTTPPSSPTASLSLSSNDTSISYEGSINLSWTAENIATCSASGGWSGNKSNTSGSEVISSLTSNTTFTLNCSGVYGNVSDSVDVTVADNPCDTTVQTFSYTGGNQVFTVPSNCTLATIRLWGAAGGGFTTNQEGNAGGFTIANLTVSGGETYNIYVGGGGGAASGNGNTGAGGAANGGWPNGGGGGGHQFNNGDYGGGGGGRSSVRSGSTELITAGGGGGVGSLQTPTNYSGAGGGTVGETGTGGYHGGGGGGTQVSGGSAPAIGSCTTGPTAGSAFQGGGGGAYDTGSSGANGGGGGGDGYYGGGGASCDSPGGGGSGYCGGAGVSDCTTTGGTNKTTAGTSDPYYNSSIGGGTTSTGENGLVVIIPS